MKINCEDKLHFKIPKATFKDLPFLDAQIYIANTQNISKSRLNTFHNLLSEIEQEKVARYYFDKDRNMSILAHGLKRLVLSKATGLSPKELSFSKNEYGKPILNNGKSMGFNLSHSSNWIALMIGDSNESEIGIDIEFDRQFTDYQLITNNFFNTEEQENIKSPHDFFKFWTRKEAVLKVLGVGLINDLKSIQTANAENVCFPNSPKMEVHFDKEIYLKSIPFLDGWISFGGLKNRGDFSIFELSENI